MNMQSKISVTKMLGARKTVIGNASCCREKEESRSWKILEKLSDSNFIISKRNETGAF